MVATGGPSFVATGVPACQPTGVRVQTPDRAPTARPAPGLVLESHAGGPHRRGRPWPRNDPPFPPGPPRCYPPPVRRRVSRFAAVPLAAAVGLCGCAAVTTAPADAPAGAVVVRSQNREAVWERTVSVLHRFGFRTAVENKLDGTIETEYVVGSGLQESFRKDSVGFANRLEDTLQSTRRRLVVTVRPADPLSATPAALTGGAGGYRVTVRAFKEQEDVRGVVANTTGGATFQNAKPLDRDLRAVDGQFGPSAWVPLGRDPALERAVLAALAGR